jgi:23S rRNA pseudouridine1911/1915/1917 synthase
MRYFEEDEEIDDGEPLALFPEEVAPYKERKTRAQRFAERAANAANRKAKAAERKRIKQEKAARKRGVAPEDFVQPGYEPTIDPDLL